MSTPAQPASGDVAMLSPGDPVLLTGGTGYLGKALAHELVEAGYRVTLLARRGARRQGLPTLALRWQEGDLLDPATWRPVLAQVRAVVHTAGIVKNWERDRTRFDRVNVEALDVLLRECRLAGVSRVVYTSSFFVLGPSQGPLPHDEGARSPGLWFNDYDRTKLRAADVVRRHAEEGLDVVSCLPTVIYGPGERTEGNHVARILEDLLRGRLPGLIGNGEQVWNYAYVEDVARGHCLALAHGARGASYLLGGENATLRGFLDLACDLAGRPRLRRRIPLWVLSALAAAQQLRAELLHVPPQLTPGMVRTYAHHWACDDARARAELGYQGRGLREGLRLTLDWLAREGAGGRGSATAGEAGDAARGAVGG
jgi:farnesol dehydrogenase